MPIRVRPQKIALFEHEAHFGDGQTACLTTQQGLNEHTNGLLRQYLPKKTPFDTLTQKQLDKIVAKINNRPRKVLGYLTPYEDFSP
jgi:IS30 family transposase